MTYLSRRPVCNYKRKEDHREIESEHRQTEHGSQSPIDKQTNEHHLRMRLNCGSIMKLFYRKSLNGAPNHLRLTRMTKLKGNGQLEFWMDN